MHNGKSIIDGKEVVTSDSLIVFQGQSIEIFPFVHDDDPDFKLIVSFDVSEDDSRPKIKSEPSPGDTPTVLLKVSASPSAGIFSTSKPLSFANDADFNYYIACVVNIFGSLERHTIVLSYTVTKDAK